MAGEVFSWPDGNIYLWTGTATASGLVSFATDTTLRLVHGAENVQALNGVYHNTPTGKIAEVNIGALYCENMLALVVMASAQTAVHAHLSHNNHGLGSGGVNLWSGYLDSVEIMGRERDLYRARVVYHANIWSAY